jgi:hypothetical protein
LVEANGVVNGVVVATEESLELREASDEELSEQLGRRKWNGWSGLEVEARMLNAETRVGDIECGEEEEQRPALGDFAEQRGLGK